MFVDAGLVEAGEIGFTTGFILDALSGRKIKKTDKKLGTVTDEGFFPAEGEVGEQGELFQTRVASPFVEEGNVGFETAEDRGELINEKEETKDLLILLCRIFQIKEYRIHLN